MVKNNITPKNEQCPSQEPNKKYYIRAQVLLRVLASLTTFVASLVMVLNKESRDFGGFQLNANFKSSPAFEFFVIGNAVVCAYSLISIPFVFKSMVEGYTLPLLDLLSMGLAMASASAATAIAYLGKKGNAEVGWSMVCPYYEKFCGRVGISLLFSFLGFLLTLLTCSLSSVYKTKLIANA